MVQHGTFSRRSFLAVFGTAATATLIAACSGSQSSSGSSGAGTTGSSSSSSSAATTTTSSSSASTSSGSAPTPTPQPAAKAAPASSGPISLAFWCMPIAGGTDWQKWLKDTGNAYTQKNPDVKIEPLFMTWDLIQKVLTSIAGGSPPDLLGRGSFGYLVKALQAGVAQEVTLPDEFRKDLPDGYYEATLFKGKDYLIPWFTLAQGPVLNLTLVKEAKAESLLPKSPAESWDWNQWLELMKATTRKRPNGKQAWGTMIFTQTKTPNYHWETWQYFWNQGVHIYKDPQSSACSSLTTDAGVKVLQFLHDLYYVDKVVPNPASVRESDIGTYWSQGDLVYRAGGGGISMAQAKGEKVDKKTLAITDPGGFEWMFVQNPTSPGVPEQCWGGPGIDTHLEPFRQTDDAKLQALMDFAFYLVNPENEAGMIPFEIPVRTSVVKDKLTDKPLDQYVAKYLVPGSHGWPPDGNSTKLLDIFETHFQNLYLGKSPSQVGNAYSADANAATGCKA